MGSSEVRAAEGFGTRGAGMRRGRALSCPGARGLGQRVDFGGRAGRERLP